MTLLDEYQALPDKKLNYNNIGRMYEAMGEENPRAEAIEEHIDTAHAIVRLLCRALREAESALPHVLSERRKIMADEIGALLTAVSRDFQEGA